MAERKKTKKLVQKPVRPKKLRLIDIIPTFVEEAKHFFSLGMKIDQIARAFGIQPSEFRQYLRDDPELAAAFYHQRSQNISKVAETLLEKATSDDPRNNNATFYYLDTVANFSNKFKDSDDGLDSDLRPQEIKITSTDSNEAMRQYERIMKD